MVKMICTRTGAAVSICLLLIVPALAAGQASETDAYVSIHGPDSVSVSLHKIGILLKHGANRAAFTMFTDSLGLSDPDTLTDFSFTLNLPDTLSRQEVVAFARQVENLRPDLIAEAGLAVTPRNARRPLIVTDKFIVRFLPGTSRSAAIGASALLGADILDSGLAPGIFLMQLRDTTSTDALTVSRVASQDSSVAYAHPNWIHTLRFHTPPEYLPLDAEFGRQWHHRNVGQGVDCAQGCPGQPCPPSGYCDGSQGTEDADLDTPSAWAILRNLQGGAIPLVAVIDGGFELRHPDLQAAFWSNGGFFGKDYFNCDDCNGNQCERCEDDNPGWEPSPENTLFDHDAHGTPVAGLVGARWDNTIGVVGACPQARLMLIRRGFDEYFLARAFAFARQNGADIVTCSWGHYNSDPATPTLHNEVQQTVSSGAVVLFSMDYADDESIDCKGEPARDLASRSDVIAVSASTNSDRKLAIAGCGDYVDVLSPSGRGTGTPVRPYRGTLNVVTTDVLADSGYNTFHAPLQEGCPDGWESSNKDYTRCFGGTSAATPTAAGVAGMLLWAKPDLAPADIQKLLQDTADKIDESAAGYGDETGFSDPPPSTSLPTPNPGGLSTHAFGRLNAYEAVRVAASVSVGGRNGIDLFVRDNRLDWGNTERPSNVNMKEQREFISHWRSMDIKIDARADQGVPDPESDIDASERFDSILDENPQANETNHIYVRLRNRGFRRAPSATVKLYWVHAGTAMPAMPADFWSGFSTNTFTQTNWHWIGEVQIQGVEYSGCTEAKESRMSTTLRDSAPVRRLSWTAPVHDPAQPNHYCILAIVDSPDDRVGPYERFLSGTALRPEDFIADALTPSDNNVTHRNYTIIDSNMMELVTERFYVRNPTRFPMEMMLRVAAPRAWKTRFLKPIPRRLGPGEEKLVKLEVALPQRGATGEVTIIQEHVEPKSERRTPVGGLTLGFHPRHRGTR